NQALAMGPDIVLLPELCWCGGAKLDEWFDFAETQSSPRVERFAELARRRRCYIGLPILEKRGRKFFNTLLLLDRRGRLVGQYDKLFLTAHEQAMGISAGERPKTYQADFGKLGAAICFDLNFFELMEYWAGENVDLILFPSAYRGGETLAAWAMEAKCYIAA